MRRAPPDWVAGYVGLPFKVKGRDRDGVDCWGLVRLVIAERTGLELPSYIAGYAGTSLADAADLERLIAGGKADYVEVARGAERALDVVSCRTYGRELHVGLVVAPATMLHIEAGTDAGVERYDGVVWRHRVDGIYRHRSLTGAPPA